MRIQKELDREQILNGNLFKVIIGLAIPVVINSLLIFPWKEIDCIIRLLVLFQ